MILGKLQLSESVPDVSAIATVKDWTIHQIRRGSSIHWSVHKNSYTHIYYIVHATDVKSL